jgi:type I restriction-modification system DNA methylase subunit
LKAHLWSAADILRGSLGPADYHQPVMTLMFMYRLNDTFEENAENLIQTDKNDEKESLCQITTCSQNEETCNRNKNKKEEERNERLADSSGKVIE